MKINEVEQTVGITKRNIRYYEREGLLAPNRNSENGYRDYGPEDVDTLKKVKLLRKLAFPMEEIRKLETGPLTVADAAKRHMIFLQSEERNLQTMQVLCEKLCDSGGTLAQLDADVYLSEMDKLEQEGTRFVNIKKSDTRTKYVGPIIAAAVFVAMMVFFIAFMVWAMNADPQNAPPWGLFVFIVAIPVVIILGVLLALFQRMKQIRGGEEDAASEY
ncbi:MAG: MerR family transcriptional regulator [Oscillospiraceae bacterium]